MSKRIDPMKKLALLWQPAPLWERARLWEPAPAGDAREAGAIIIARWGALPQQGRHPQVPTII